VDHLGDGPTFAEFSGRQGGHGGGQGGGGQAGGAGAGSAGVGASSGSGGPSGGRGLPWLCRGWEEHEGEGIDGHGFNGQDEA